MIWSLLLCVLCGVFWRMGGAAGYDKLWRRVGSALCMFVVILLVGSHVQLEWAVFSLALLVLGCTSYFGWINYLIRPFWKDIEIDSEYWWNFAVENVVIQSAILPYKPTALNYGFAIGWGLIVALVKVWIDGDEDGKKMWWNEDVLSEWWHGFGNCVGLLINSAL